MSMQGPSEAAKALFASVSPLDARVTIKPIFGSLAGFIKTKRSLNNAT
ncbi:hypothetical protein SAMN05216312_110193 [Cohnella sp. OV330]|nr:hypothetical protein [Cohnella sp. OV330]SFB50157.1 hypothetical protein SAMN05216312_110193 [Cohnella sp. OV330]